LAGSCVGVVIPTYNERENIARLLDELTRVLEESGICYRIVVVDDNSPDGTAEVVKKYSERKKGVEVVVRPGKLGLGSAIVDGLKKLLEYPEVSWIATMDADFSHDPRELPRLLKRAESADVVQGSRYVEGGSIKGWGLHRRLVSWGANLVVRILYRTGIRDNTGNYRVYSRRVAEDLVKYTESRGYEWVVEALVTAKKLGYRVVEEPITFVDRRAGRSKLGVLSMVKWLARLLKLQFRIRRLAAE